MRITVYWSEFCFFKQKTAYEMRISDWSSDVCSSDLPDLGEIQVGDRDAGIMDRADIAVRIDRRQRLVGDRQDLGAIVPVTANGSVAGIVGDRVGAHGDVELCGIARQIGRASCRARVCQYV